MYGNTREKKKAGNFRLRLPIIFKQRGPNSIVGRRPSTRRQLLLSLTPNHFLLQNSTVQMMSLIDCDNNYYAYDRMMYFLCNMVSTSLIMVVLMQFLMIADDYYDNFTLITVAKRMFVKR